jgi:hypothetical protein
MKTGMPISSYDTLDAVLLKDPYDRIPILGQSIGAETEKAQSAGTLGAYVRITGGLLDGGTYGLTCDHVVFTKSESSLGICPNF